MVALGERRNYQYQAPNSRHVAALDFVQQHQSHHGNYTDEQRVPQSNWQEKSEAMDKNYNYTMNDAWHDFLSNNNILTYPVLQSDDTMNIGQGQQGVKGQVPLRQSSIPNGTAALDRYLHSDMDYYSLDSDILDPLSGYENEGFSVEDYIDLDKVNVCEQDGINFDVPIKQEKPDNSEMNNLEEMERMLNTNLQNPNNDWAQNINDVNYRVPQGTGNEPNFTDFSNLNELINNSGIYNSSNANWHSQYQGITPLAPPAVSRELVIKTEPDDFLSNCDHTNMENSTSGLTIPEEELVEMPVSRFNELLATLPHDQCCEAKDVRRRGKNKKAARLCRKRKLENISNLADGKSQLQEQINKLNRENDIIISETEELKRNIDTICQMLINGISNGTDSLQ